MTKIQNNPRTFFNALNIKITNNFVVSPEQSDRAAGLLSAPKGAFGLAPSAFGARGLPPMMLPPIGYNSVALAGALQTMGRGGFSGARRLCCCRPMTSYMFRMQRQYMPMQMGTFMKGVEKATGTDKFATHKSCRTGKHNPSNLNNSDHIKLALHDLLSKQKSTRGGFKSFKDPKELAKKLEEEYGIKAEVTTVKSKEGDELKALKFENGGVFADGAGDGQLDMGDYNFKAAIKDIEKKYGAKSEDLVKAMKDTKKAYDANPQMKQFGSQEDFYAHKLRVEGESNKMLEMYKKRLGEAQKDPGIAALLRQAGGSQASFFPWQQIAAMFTQAYALAWS